MTHIVIRERYETVWEPVACGVAAEMNRDEAAELAARYAQKWPAQTFAVAKIETIFTTQQSVHSVKREMADAI